MSVRYTRVGWQDAPSTDTPIDAANLNHMDNGILALSEEVDTELPLLQEQINDISTGIDAQIDEKVPPEVSSWLTEHVDPVGSAVVVDDSLTIQGAAADAKKTGDKFTALKDGLTAVESDVTDLKEDIAELSSVPSNVREAIYTLFSKAIYTETGLTTEKSIIEAWASVVTSISISEASISFSGSGTTQLIATTVPSGKTVTWSSSNQLVATVDNSGLVTSVGNGTCTITASSGDKTATCECSVSGFETHTITNTLTNATNNNTDTHVEDGEPYTATLTPESGRKFGASSVTITMGGVDITSTAYSNGSISIPSVTDNVVITAYANEFDLTTLVYGSVTFTNNAYEYGFTSNQKNRLTFSQCAFKLVKGRTYTFSCGSLWSTLDSGVRVLSGTPSAVAEVDFSITEYVRKIFNDITTSVYSSSWQHIDYTYTADDDGQVFGVTLKKQNNANFTDEEKTSLLANISLVESMGV